MKQRMSGGKKSTWRVGVGAMVALILASCAGPNQPAWLNGAEFASDRNGDGVIGTYNLWYYFSAEDFTEIRVTNPNGEVEIRDRESLLAPQDDQEVPDEENTLDSVGRGFFDVAEGAPVAARVIGSGIEIRVLLENNTPIVYGADGELEIEVSWSDLIDEAPEEQ